ncbi:MAG: hypothetical protein LEGION0398_MBIBDBAK_00102 [Legionellaceae bacterium]
MKKLYWQSHRFSRLTLLFVCLLSFVGIITVEKFKTYIPQNYYHEKLAATLLTKQCMLAIKKYRLKKHIPIEYENDPQHSGLIGEAFNFLTTGHGSLTAKQTSINPNFSALIVAWLKSIGIKAGDTIALGMNGSYPALNIAVLAAAKTLQLKPILIVNMSSTQWGGNIPRLLWLDMLSILNKQDLIPYTPIAATIAETKNQLKNNPRKSNYYLLKLIKKYKIPFIDTIDNSDIITKRMNIYYEQAKKNHSPIKIYINVGSSVTVHRKLGKHKNIKPGLNTIIPIAAATSDSVMLRFMKNGIPIINLTNIETLAEKYELPISPSTHPILGKGNIFFEKHYNTYLAITYLFAILVFLILSTILNKARFNRHYNSGVKTTHEE